MSTAYEMDFFVEFGYDNGSAIITADPNKMGFGKKSISYKSSRKLSGIEKYIVRDALSNFNPMDKTMCGFADETPEQLIKIEGYAPQYVITLKKKPPKNKWFAEK